MTSYVPPIMTLLGFMTLRKVMHMCINGHCNRIHQKIDHYEIYERGLNRNQASWKDVLRFPASWIVGKCNLLSKAPTLWCFVITAWLIERETRKMQYVVNLGWIENSMLCWFWCIKLGILMRQTKRQGEEECGCVIVLWSQMGKNTTHLINLIYWNKI